MFPAVWSRVVAGSYRSQPATLRGFRRQRVRGQDYPALEQAPPGALPGAVDGVLYLDVAAGDLASLDAFEGADYRRIEVRVTLRQDAAGTPGTLPAGSLLAADTYLFVAADKVEPRDWDPAEFERERIGRFLREYPPPRPGPGS